MNAFKTPGTMSELLTRQQLADYLGLCLSNVDKLPIPRIKLSARRFCFKKSDVDLWLENQKEIRG